MPWILHSFQDLIEYFIQQYVSDLMVASYDELSLTMFFDVVTSTNSMPASNWPHLYL